MNSTICSVCGLSFTNLNILKAHRKLHCRFCQKLFISHIQLQKHMDIHVTSTSTEAPSSSICQSTPRKYCKDCKEMVAPSLWLTHVRTNKHKNNCEKVTLNDELTMRKSDFNGRIETYSIMNKNEELLFPEEFFNKAKECIVMQLKLCRLKLTTFKTNMELTCEYMKLTDDEVIISPIVHTTKMALITFADNIEEIYKKHVEEIIIKMGEFQERDSGWTLLYIKWLEININKASIIRGSHFIALPNSIVKKGACINVVNDDVYCFKWSLIAALYKDENLTHRQRKNCNVYNIGHIECERIHLGEIEINFEGLHFPLPLHQIKKFEKQNEISINVFGYDGSSIVGPYYLTVEEKEVHINLLLLQSGDNFHYVLIKDISK